MTRSQLIDALAARRRLGRSGAERVVDVVLDGIRDALVAGDRVELRGFGSFQPRSYQGYTGRNPRTGESVAVAPKRLPVFRPGKELRERVDLPASPDLPEDAR